MKEAAVSFFDELILKKGTYRTEKIQKLICAKFTVDMLKFYSGTVSEDAIADIPKSTFSKRRREFCEFGMLDQENGITEFGKSLLFIYDSVDIYLKENGFKPSENRAEFLNLIFAPKWKGRVIWYIYMIPSARFNEMCRNIEGISHKVLNDILIELEMHKVIKKTERDGNMPKTEYELTPLGNEIAKFVVEIGVCCKRHNVITQKVTISVE